MPSNQTPAEQLAEIRARLDLVRLQRFMLADPAHLNAENALESIDWLTEALGTVLGHVDIAHAHLEETSDEFFEARNAAAALEGDVCQMQATIERARAAAAEPGLEAPAEVRQAVGRVLRALDGGEVTPDAGTET